MRAFHLPQARSLAAKGARRLPDVQRLVGVSLREGYGTAVTGRVGGPLGCFHIFTLLRLIVRPSSRWCARAHAGSHRTPGGPCSRAACHGWAQGEGLSIVLRGTLFDLYYRPGADALPLERNSRRPSRRPPICRSRSPASRSPCQGRVRRGGPGVERVGAWEPYRWSVTLSADKCSRLHRTGAGGLRSPYRRGAAATLLFMLAPTLMQCFPSLAEELELRPRRAEATHGAVDSCHMCAPTAR